MKLPTSYLYLFFPSRYFELATVEIDATGLYIVDLVMDLTNDEVAMTSKESNVE